MTTTQDDAQSVRGGTNVVTPARLNELLEPAVERFIQRPEALDLFGVFRQFVAAASERGCRNFLRRMNAVKIVLDRTNVADADTSHGGFERRAEETHLGLDGVCCSSSGCGLDHVVRVFATAYQSQQDEKMGRFHDGVAFTSLNARGQPTRLLPNSPGIAAACGRQPSS